MRVGPAGLAELKRLRVSHAADATGLLNGFAFKSSQYSRDEGMPLVRIRDVGSNGSDTKYIGEYEDRYLVRAGDLLAGMDGDFNCARWNASPALLNQRVCKVSVDVGAGLIPPLFAGEDAVLIRC